MKMAKGNFFVRLCYAAVGKTKDTSKMTTKEVIEEFLRQKGVSSSREYFTILRVGNVRKDIGLNFFSKKKDFSNVPVDRDYPKEALGFGSNKLLNVPDHKKHAKDMGFKNTKEYQKAANEFWNSRKGKIYYSRARKRFYMYNDKTRLLLTIEKDGIVHTFFRAEKGEFEKNIKGWDDLVEI